MEKYEKIRFVNKGAFGSAVLVRQKSDGKQYIMKVINVSHMSPKELNDAKQECTLLSQLTHPNIVEYREHFVANGELCIVMAFAEGGDLYSKIQSQRGRLFSEDDVCNYFVQILLAMKHVHARRILHRDLKSQNIFLTGGQKLIKLGDFGIAKILQNSMACARTAIGTPYYLSPEICENKPYNRKSDVWSLGCIAYELCTLQCPFNGRDMKALVLSILKGAYAPISTKFSEQMRALVGAMLTRDAAARPTVDQLLATPLMQGRMRAFLQIPITVPQQLKLVLPAKALPAPPEKPRTPAPQQKPRTPALAPAPPVKAAAAAEDESVRELIAEQARVADQARRAAEEGKRRQAEAEKRRLQAETEKREVERRRLAEARLDEERKERERERKREAEAESARRRDEEKRRRDEARLDEERKERERRREAEAESARRRDEAEKRRLAERRQMEADRERARERLKAEAEQVHRSAQEEGGRLQLEDRVLAILQKRQASSGDEASGSRPSSAVAQPSDTDEAKLAPAAQTNAPADRTARILVARRQRRKEQSVHEGVPVAADTPPLADFGAAPSSARSERERAEAAQKERRASVGSAAVTPPSVQEIARRQFFMDQAAAKMNKQRAMADFQGNAAGLGLGLDLPSQAKPPLSTGQMEVLRLPEYPAGHADRNEPRVAASAADAASSVTKVKDLKEKRKQNERLAMEAELASIRKQHFAEKREAAERLRRMAEAQHAQKDERARIGAPASAAAAPPSSSSTDAATLQMRKQQREDARAALRAMIHSDRSRSQPGGSAATDACLSAQDLPKRVHLSLPPAESHTRLPKATHASLPEPRALEGNQGVSDEQSMSERLRMMAQQEGWSRRSVDGAPAPFTSAVAVIDVQQTDPPAVAMGTDDGDGAESETVEEIFQTAPQPGLFQIDEAESADFSAMLDEMRATLNPLSTAPAVADTDDVDEGNAQLPLTRFLHKNATLRITGAGEAQSAHHRIEALRNFLEHELGVRKFVQAYDIVKSTYHGADEPNSGERIGGILQSAELEYVSLIVQLIICEEGVYGQLSPAEAKGEMHRAICRLPQISTSISRPGQAG